MSEPTDKDRVLAQFERGCFSDLLDPPRKAYLDSVIDPPRVLDPPRAEQVEHILQFFAYAHLPPHLMAVSEPFCRLANELADALPRNPERTVALRKLLEAKDAAVRARAAK